MFKLNDKVRIKKEWCNSPFEHTLTLTIINVNEATNCYTIETIFPGWTLPTNQVVSTDMIKKI